VTIPTLVLVGGASPAWMIDVGKQVADALPNGRLSVLEGQEHVVSPEVLVPVLAEFLATSIEEPNGGGPPDAAPSPTRPTARSLD
jgi:pimeloyl-ACP methyl ester carboxylesterase